MSYVPDMTGRYTILIKYGGDEIPYSPYRIRALPTGDASKCTVTGETSRRCSSPCGDGNTLGNNLKLTTAVYQLYMKTAQVNLQLFVHFYAFALFFTRSITGKTFFLFIYIKKILKIENC